MDIKKESCPHCALWRVLSGWCDENNMVGKRGEIKLQSAIDHHETNANRELREFREGAGTGVAGLPLQTPQWLVRAATPILISFLNKRDQFICISSPLCLMRWVASSRAPAHVPLTPLALAKRVYVYKFRIGEQRAVSSRSCSCAVSIALRALFVCF